VFRKALVWCATGVLLEHLSASLQRILAGSIAGSLLGVPIGLAMGSFGRAEAPGAVHRVLRFISLGGHDHRGCHLVRDRRGVQIFLIIYDDIFIVTWNTAAGVSAIAPNNKIRAAQSLGPTRAQIFFHVALPATVPYILTGMRCHGNSLHHDRWPPSLDRRQRRAGKMLWDGRCS